MNRRFAVTCRGEKLLGAHARTGDDDVCLCPGPLQRLLDLRARCVRELGGLVPRLLEEAGALGLGVAELLARVAVGLREDLAGLGPGRVQDLSTLALGFLADARNLCLALLELHLRLANLLLGLPDLLGRRLLCVALDRVRELGGRADQVEGVHADGMAGRLGDRAARCGLEHAQLRLERGGVFAESVEGLLDLAPIEPLTRPRDVFEAGQRRQRRSLDSPWVLTGHLRYASTPPCGTGIAEKYDRIIGRKDSLP